ncbi:hypothetical protein TcasGA2_TC033261 [Tribolium castaneum]|uniref:Uncharacterized protein n=1 Tax=Tribolium castaneum TaxID=7070 RepID=A0A139WHL2_TRICA|nr:hypothetical protein TcasGA2_TC033261 [Tribolium castaneum]
MLIRWKNKDKDKEKCEKPANQKQTQKKKRKFGRDGVTFYYRPPRRGAPRWADTEASHAVVAARCGRPSRISLALALSQSSFGLFAAKKSPVSCARASVDCQGEGTRA